MGYSTDFTGEWKVTPPLKPAHKAYLKAFAERRHMERDEQITAGRPDPIREAVGLPVGVEGGYFIGDGDDSPLFGISNAYGIKNENHEPKGQPGLWCQWVPNENGDAIKWDGGEKFYNYIEWIEYLVANFLTPWGYNLKGKVKWNGEGHRDRGFICISNNQVYVNQEPTALDKLVEAVSKPKKGKKGKK
jgi:hypothetical protein